MVLETIVASLFVFFAKFGLAGLFGGSFILSTIFVPGLVEALVPFFLSLKFNPVLVLLIATAGSIVGGIVNYFIGFFGSKLVEKDLKNILKKTKSWTTKWGELTVFITSLVPGFPFDIVAVTFGVFKLDFKSFLVSMAVGKFLKITLIVFSFREIMNLAIYFGLI